MADEKLNEVYYQPDHLWTGSKAIRELQKIKFMPKKHIKRWLTKQAFWQVHIPPPKGINYPHYDVTTPNEKDPFDLLYVPHNVFEGNTYKYVDARLLEPVRPRQQVRLHLCWKQYIKRVVFLSVQKCFNMVMDQSLNVM